MFIIFCSSLFSAIHEFMYAKLTFSTFFSTFENFYGAIHIKPENKYFTWNHFYLKFSFGLHIWDVSSATNVHLDINFH